MKRNLAFVVILALLATILISACTTTHPTGKFVGLEATVYKSPTCGCCVGYIAFLEKNGIKVNTVEQENLNPIKQKYGIPRNMESCHTTVIGDYFVEGHVPLKAVEKLMQEKPKINGIALPNMPSGTPGMPGPKKGPYKIYSLTGGLISEYVQI